MDVVVTKKISYKGSYRLSVYKEVVIRVVDTAGHNIEAGSFTGMPIDGTQACGVVTLSFKNLALVEWLRDRLDDFISDVKEVS